jgi:hypothetical protein
MGLGSIGVALWTAIVMTGIPVFSLKPKQVPEAFLTCLAGMAGRDTK